MIGKAGFIPMDMALIIGAMALQNKRSVQDESSKKNLC